MIGNPDLAELRGRAERFREELRADGIPAALLVQNVGRYYLSGTMQAGFVVLPPEGGPLVLVRRDPERAAAESPFDVSALASLRDLSSRLRQLLGEIPSPLGLELDVLPVHQLERLRGLLPGVEFADASRALQRARAVKSPFEVEHIREAARVVAEVVGRVPAFLGEGVSELELTARLECELRLRGHGGVTRMRGFNQEIFYGHVMAGPTAAALSFLDAPTGGEGMGPALAQGSSPRRIRPGEPVVVDLVGNCAGYLSDQTRMFSLGEPEEPFAEAYQAAVEVQRAVAEAAVPGANAGDLYRTALEAASRTPFAAQFMGESQKVAFVGHGIGLEVDEFPFLARGADLRLAEGMVVAVEPKFIFERRGVVGVEDTFLITKDGAERLTPSPQTWGLV